jgi:hypothetical protein
LLILTARQSERIQYRMGLLQVIRNQGYGVGGPKVVRKLKVMVGIKPYTSESFDIE